MNSIIGLGKYLFAIPFIVFGVMHFMNADAMAGWAPFGGSMMVYITGVAMLCAGISIVIGKYDKLACVLLAILLLLYMIPHFQMLADDEMQMGNILKNISLAGGALAYASMAKDDSVIG